MVLEDLFTPTEMKDGLATLARVEDLVSMMKSESESRRSSVDLKSQRVMIGRVLAATEERECLNHFVHLNGLSLLNSWLHESQRLTKDEEDFVDELVNVLLGVLDRLPVDLEKWTALGIGSLVSQLLCHESHEIQERARGLTSKWSKEIKESTPEKSHSLQSVTADLKDSEEDAKLNEGVDSMISSSSVNPDDEKDVSHDDNHPAESMKTSDDADITEKSTPSKSQTLLESHGCGFDLNEDISIEDSTLTSPRERNVEKSTLKANLMEIDLNVMHDNDDDDDDGRFGGAEKFNVDLNWAETDDGPRHHSLSNLQDPSFNLSTAISSSSILPQPRDFDLNYDPSSLTSGQSSLRLSFRERSSSRSYPHEDSEPLTLISSAHDEKTVFSGGAADMLRGSIGSTSTSAGNLTLSLELEEEQQGTSPRMGLKRKEPDCGLDSCKVSTNS